MSFQGEMGDTQSVVIAWGPADDSGQSDVVAVFGPFRSDVEAEQWPGIPGWSAAGLTTEVRPLHEAPEWEDA